MAKRKIFYGWIIVAAALVGLCTLVGIRFSFGVFFKSIEAEFVLDRTTTSSVFSAFTLLAGLFAVISGWALDRYGPRLVVSAMGCLTGFSLLISSQTTSLWQLYITYSVILAMGTGGALIVLTSVVSRWFYKKRGTAIGIATSGTGLGTLVVAPFAAYLISNFGWRVSYVTLGTIAVLTIVSVAMILRKDPSQIGLLPDGEKPSVTEISQISKGNSYQMTGLTPRQSLKTRSLWLMFAVWFFYALCLHLVLAHIVAHATDIGIPTMEASTIISVMGVFHLVSRLSIGKISDTIGRKKPAAICAVLGSLALVYVIWSNSLWMFYIFAALFGLSWGGIGVTTIAMVSDIFGERSVGTIMGSIDIGFAIGSAVGSALGGFIFDLTNSYGVAFAIGAASMLLMALLVTGTKRETKN